MTNINQAKELVGKANIGQIVPIFKVLDIQIDALEYFEKISDYGRNKNSIFFESAEKIDSYSELSLGTSNPCLRIWGKDNRFEIKALNNIGKEILEFIKKDIKFCKKIVKKKDSISGTFETKLKDDTYDPKLRNRIYADTLKSIIFKFKPAFKMNVPSNGIFGGLSFEFGHTDNFPDARQDLAECPDYVFYFADNLFVVNHKTNQTYFIANAIITNNKKDMIYKRCIKIINDFEAALSLKVPKIRKFKLVQQELEFDSSKQEVEEVMVKVIQNIIYGNIYQGHISKSLIVSFNSEPLDIYKKFKHNFPQPYMYFMNDRDFTLIGSSHLTLSIDGENEKVICMNPSSNSVPRGTNENKEDNNLDQKYEAELRADSNIITDHLMMVDQIRNEITRVTKPGTRMIKDFFNIMKLSNEQYIYSKIIGVLKEGMDVVQASNLFANNNFITGIPKFRSLKLIKDNEKSRRGFYGGFICYITPYNTLNGCFASNTIYLKNNKAFIRAGERVNYDSDQKKVVDEIEKKLASSLRVITECGGFK